MNTMENIHPAVIVFYFLSVMVTAMFVSNPVIVIAAFFGGVFFLMSRKPKREMLSGFRLYLPLFLVITLTNPLFSHNGVTPLFFLNGNPITVEAFVYGALFAGTLIAVMIWCRCFSEIVTTEKFLFLSERLFPKLALVLSMTLRFLPLFKRQMQKVDRASKAMGLYAEKNFFEKIRAKGRVFMAVIGWAFENAMETANSMRARGYGIGKRTHFSLFRMTGRDGVLFGTSLTLILLTLIGTFRGETSFSCYPAITRLSLTPLSILTYSAFILLCFLPVICEAKEAIKWHYCLAKH